MITRLEKVIHHPLHRFLGVTTIEAEQGQGKLSVTAAEGNLNPAGVLHGGALYTLADVCAYAGLCSLLDDNTEAVTHDLHVSVMRPVLAGQQVDFVSQVVRQGKRIAFLHVEASVEGRIVATATVTKSLVSG